MDDIDWRIVGERPAYRVASDGRTRRFGGYKDLTPYVHAGGYLRVTLSGPGGGLGRLVHRLVATAFIPNPENKPYVNHIDGIRTNNCAANLEWATNFENSNKKVFPAKTRLGRKVVQLSFEGYVDRIWDSASQAAKSHGLDKSNIGLCCRRRDRKTGGISWAYLDQFETEQTGEEWRPWAQKESAGTVSNMGRVRTLKGAILSGSLINGYVRYNGVSVHRLVAATFPELCPKPDGCDVVNHRDGVKTNNAAKNLEWMTHSQNSHHAVRSRLNPVARPVMRLDDGAVFYSMIAASRATSTDASLISKACKTGSRAGDSLWKFLSYDEYDMEMYLLELFELFAEKE